MNALRLISKRRCLLNQNVLLTSCHELSSDGYAQSKTFTNESVKVNPEDTYDIVINGGGIVGFSLLAALKSSPFLSSKRILLIEQQSPPKQSKTTTNDEPRTFSNRVFAITKGSRSLFERIGIWSSLEPYSKQVSQMFVWGDHFQNGVHFRYDHHDREMCYILENNRMIRALHETILAQRAEVVYETSVVDIQQLPISGDVNIESPCSLGIHLQLARNPTLDVSDEAEKRRTIRTSLLVGCDGFRSLVRSKSTLPYFEADLEQMGIVGTLELDSPFPDNNTALQRFENQANLVIALLPLDEQHSSLVLSMSASRLKDWMSLSEEEFVAQLNRILVREARSNPVDKLIASFQSGGKPMFGTRLPPQIVSMVPNSRAAFPLGFGTTLPHLVGTIKSGTPLIQSILKRDNLMDTAIIGDAAHRVHPLAGQGLNLGLGDAHELVEALESKLQIGFEIFGPEPAAREQLSRALLAFERERVKKLVPMLAAIHSMQTIFSYTPSSLLSMLDQLAAIKSGVVSFANSR